MTPQDTAADNAADNTARSEDEDRGPTTRRRALIAGGLGAVVGGAITTLKPAAAQSNPEIQPCIEPEVVNTFGTTTTVNNIGSGPVMAFENTTRSPTLAALAPVGAAISATGHTHGGFFKLGQADRQNLSSAVYGDGGIGAITVTHATSGEMPQVGGLFVGPPGAASGPFTDTLAIPTGGVAGVGFGDGHVGGTFIGGEKGYSAWLDGKVKLTAGGKVRVKRNRKGYVINHDSITENSILLTQIGGSTRNPDFRINTIRTGPGYATLRFRGVAAKGFPLIWCAFDVC